MFECGSVGKWIVIFPSGRISKQDVEGFPFRDNEKSDSRRVFPHSLPPFAKRVFVIHSARAETKVDLGSPSGLPWPLLLRNPPLPHQRQLACQGPVFYKPLLLYKNVHAKEFQLDMVKLLCVHKSCCIPGMDDQKRSSLPLSSFFCFLPAAFQISQSELVCEAEPRPWAMTHCRLSLGVSGRPLVPLVLLAGPVWVVAELLLLCSRDPLCNVKITLFQHSVFLKGRWGTFYLAMTEIVVFPELEWRKRRE